MLAQVQAKLDAMQSKTLKTLTHAYLDDRDLMKRFRQAPAAMVLHHAYIGGLLEHTLSLMKLAEAVCPNYPKINQDLVVFGLFLHDLGKCTELTWSTGFGYSDEGQLVGHIARGVVWLNEKVAKLRAAGTDIPDDLLHVLEHIILSHHGLPEYGALKVPATPEAVLIHQLDNVDAKTQMALDAARADDTKADLGGNFTEKVWALGTRLYRPDPVKQADAPPPKLGDGDLKGGIG
jgi:3'-5' exoribonuclease